MPEEFPQFINVYCVKCSHCSIRTLRRQERTFCFELFEENKEKFEGHVYPKLRKNSFWPVALSKEEDMFRNTFCLSNICTTKPVDESNTGSSCTHYEDCLTDFIDTSIHIQCRGSKYVSNFSRPAPKALSKKEQRKQERQLKFARIASTRGSKIVVKKPKTPPTPVMLCGGSVAWKELVKTME